MTLKAIAVAATVLLGASQAQAVAATINIDLSGAVTGTLIDGVGGDFATMFAGQTLAGTDVLGAPTNPLTLDPEQTMTVAFFNPGVSPAANSILPQPGNSAPLSLLLDSVANAITWTMGSGDGGSVTVDLYSLAGALVHSTVFTGLSGYDVFTISGVGDFSGMVFRNNTDGAGLRYMNFSYETGDQVIPEPATLLLLGAGLAAARARRRQSIR